MYGEGHKIHILPTLKQHAQNQIKLHSKTGTEFPLGGGGKAVTEKESQGKEILLCAVFSGLVLRSAHQNSSLWGCLPEGLHPNHLQSNISLPLGLSGGLGSPIKRLFYVLNPSEQHQAVPGALLYSVFFS